MPNMSKKQQGQNFIDLIIQQAGDFDQVINAALLNNMSITEDIPIGTEVKNNIVTNNQAVIFFSRENGPATALINSDSFSELKGIGKMKIGTTFKIG